MTTGEELIVALERADKAEATLKLIRNAIPPEPCGTCGTVKATLLVNYGPDGKCCRFVQIEESSILRMLVSVCEQYEAHAEKAEADRDNYFREGRSSDGMLYSEHVDLLVKNLVRAVKRAEKAEATNTRWEKLLADQAAVLGKVRTERDALAERVKALEDALTEIAKGEGAFSRDRLQHAGNCIENMKAVARAALNPKDTDAAKGENR